MAGKSKCRARVDSDQDVTMANAPSSSDRMDCSTDSKSAVSDSDVASGVSAGSSNGESSSVAGSTSRGSDSSVRGKVPMKSCLKNPTCIKDKCLKDAACSKTLGYYESEASTEPCLASSKPKPKSKFKKQKKIRQAPASESSTKREDTTAESTSAGHDDATATQSDTQSEAPASTKSEDAPTEASATQTEELSQGASVAAESSNGATSDASSSRAAAPAQKPSWNMSEDAILRGMKGGGATWADISKTLGKTRDDVQARWKVINGQSSSGSADKNDKKQGGDVKGNGKNDGKNDGRGKSNAAGQQKTGGTAPKVKEKAPVNNTAKVEEKKADSTKAPVADDKAKKPNNDKYKGKAVVIQSAPKREETNGDKAASAKQKKRDKTRSKKKGKKADEGDGGYILSGEEASSELSSPSRNRRRRDDAAEEERRQTRYLHKHIYKDLYPGYIEPEPDEYFGGRDCEVLASVASKYQRSKWLEMQANFYNVTGRMVPLDLIRAKCERAEQVKEQEMQASRQKTQRVEDWVDKVPDQGCEDPAP